MKLKHVGIIVVSVLAMSSAAVSAAEGDESVTTTVNGGVIHFKGEVVNAACAIDSESMNQTVELGQVRSSRLAKAGDLSSAVGFNISDQKDTQFVITPPLFSMQGKKENTLRIINATNHQLPGDRESLFWVNVKAIPAMEKTRRMRIHYSWQLLAA